jgi:hypothetical protein
MLFTFLETIHIFHYKLLSVEMYGYFKFFHKIQDTLFQY